MEPENLGRLLTTLRAHDVESYEYKDMKVIFRFPKKAMLVEAPQEQVDRAPEEQADEDEEVILIDGKGKAVKLPPGYSKLFRAVPRM